MADTVKFELVSPERILLSEEVDMVVIPGEEGNFGVLPGHAPLISSVRPGTIEVYRGNVASERIFTSGGFAEVTPERCTMLADEAVHLSAIDRAEAEAELARLDAQLPSLREAADRDDLADSVRFRATERQRNIARARIEALDQFAGR